MGGKIHQLFSVALRVDPGSRGESSAWWINEASRPPFQHVSDWRGLEFEENLRMEISEIKRPFPILIGAISLTIKFQFFDPSLIRNHAYSPNLQDLISSVLNVCEGRIFDSKNQISEMNLQKNWVNKKKNVGIIIEGRSL